MRLPPFRPLTSSSIPKTHIRLMEVSPRDGLQNEKKLLPAALKIELIRRLVEEGGVRDVEAGSFVAPKWVPQMGTTTEVVSSSVLQNLRDRFPSPRLTFPCLVPNLRGIQSLSKLPPPPSSSQSPIVDEIAVFVAATNSFSKANTNGNMKETMEVTAKVVEEGLRLGKRVRGYVSVAFGCPYEGRVDIQNVVNTTKALKDMGCYEVSIADTVGVATPLQIRNTLEAVERSGVRMEDLAIHCHDTFGTGLANVIEAVECGVRTVDAAVGGVGGCPYSPGATGNIATEDVLYALSSLGYPTILSLPHLETEPLANDEARLRALEPLAAIGEWISAELGRANSSRVGKAVAARRARREAMDEVERGGG